MRAHACNPNYWEAEPSLGYIANSKTLSFKKKKEEMEHRRVFQAQHEIKRSSMLMSVGLRIG
jgi:hypothetical protein